MDTLELAPLRILLIDDDEDDYLLTRRMLLDRTQHPSGFSPSGFHLDWVDSYEKAQQALASRQHDVYLLDYRLGLRTGLELLQEAAFQKCNAPIILMTGHGSYDLDLAAMRAGATDYLPKSEMTAPLLERTIRYALERKRTEADLLEAHEELEARVEERTWQLAQANQELRLEISERKRVEAALEIERKRLFSLLEEIPAIVYLQAPDYSIPFANSRFWEKFGNPAGKPCFEVVRSRSCPCDDCPTFRVFETNAPVEYEWTSVDGQSYQIYDYPFIDVDGSPLVLEMGIDITSRKEMEARLLQAEKFAAMGRMVASVAHELNNPLQIIKNCLFLTAQEIPDGATHREFLDMAFSETQRLSNLVVQLRELYRPRQPIPPYLIDLNAVLGELRALLTPQLMGEQVIWQQSGLEGPVYSRGGADQLKQVFLNICQNAIEAMKPGGGGTLLVHLFQEGNSVGIRFQDTGPGIPPESISKLFEPFYTTKSSGLGLGLSVCYEIIQRHSGQIQVESSPGQGASFTVWLPVAKPE